MDFPECDGEMGSFLSLEINNIELVEGFATSGSL